MGAGPVEAGINSRYHLKNERGLASRLVARSDSFCPSPTTNTLYIKLASKSSHIIFAVPGNAAKFKDVDCGTDKTGNAIHGKRCKPRITIHVANKIAKTQGLFYMSSTIPDASRVRSPFISTVSSTAYHFPFRSVAT
jgi:hypothetical protein